MLPVENSLSGTIHKNFDLLLANKDVHITGEVSIQIRHCLMARKGVKVEDVKRVLSHPVALLQVTAAHFAPHIPCFSAACVSLRRRPSHARLPRADTFVCLGCSVVRLQCQQYITENKMEQEVTYDTAGSAKMVVEGEMEDAAAIAGMAAAERYGLNILARDIQDDQDNYTRFLVLSREPCVVGPGVPAKTTVAFTLKNGPGALVNCLNVW
eukprot:SAG22_NODE_2254_length_2781_cov_2.255034_4_plen_211_part_00